MSVWTHEILLINLLSFMCIIGNLEHSLNTQ